MVKQFLNSKGVTQIYTILLGFIVALAAVFTIIGFAVPSITSQGDFFKGTVSEVKSDFDGDSYRDFQDKCPCTYGDLNGDGCPLTFTSEQKSKDLAEYHSENGCDGLVFEEGDSEVTALDSGGFQAYHSVEIAGDADSGRDDGNSLIYQACTGWVGKSCASSGTCTDFITSEYGDSCWVMISETEANTDCGQVLADQGTIISASTYSDFTDFKSTFTKGVTNDAYNLLSWGWKSSASKYGSLLCKDTFWFGCQTGQEGRNLSIGEVTYTCEAGEWKSSFTKTFTDSSDTRSYLSIELFGVSLGSGNTESKEINKACTGWVGEDSCESEGGECDNKFDHTSPTDGTSCPVMISEFGGLNDCGQVTVKQGTRISATEYSKIQTNGEMVDGGSDVDDLLEWSWKSKQDEYGSLLCKNAVWFGCHWDQEGRVFEVEGENYTCNSGEWIKNGEDVLTSSVKMYQSVELTGEATGNYNVESKEIFQACTGWVGQSGCESYVGSCNDNFIHSISNNGYCPIMISEYNYLNDCGQIEVTPGTILSSNEYLSLNYYQDKLLIGGSNVQELLGWEWKSSLDEYGSLICKDSFWHSCQGQFEGAEVSVGSGVYVCHYSNWELKE